MLTAYHEFPEDLFTNKQRSQGFVVIHVLVGIYMFYGLAVVCDDYFVASMDKICQVRHMMRLDAFRIKSVIILFDSVPGAGVLSCFCNMHLVVMTTNDL